MFLFNIWELSVMFFDRVLCPPQLLPDAPSYPPELHYSSSLLEQTTTKKRRKKGKKKRRKKRKTWGLDLCWQTTLKLRTYTGVWLIYSMSLSCE